MSTPETVLEGRDLVKYFPAGSTRWLSRPTGTVQAVDGVSFALRRGTTLGIVGESGCGKSTLARVITRLLDPSSGSLLLEGQDVTKLRGRELREFRRKVQIIFQDPYSSLNPRHSVGQIISLPMKVQNMVPPQGVKVRVQELMELVGLNPEHYNRYPHEFSGGQRQRIGIARALSLNPEIIVADEPVSALDVSIQAQILNLMQRLQRELNLSYVFIAHDLSVVRRISDDLGVMYLGKVVESGPAESVYGDPRHPYTKTLLSAIPIANPVRARQHQRIILSGEVPSPINPPSGCRFRTRCWKAEDQCATEEPQLNLSEVEGQKMERRVACHFPEWLETGEKREFRISGWRDQLVARPTGD
jgi:oligopeptide/dipeptide ABC transporter ATP-binding protein